MSDKYTLNFDYRPYEELNSFALLAVQKHNLGDKGDWFNCFRGGLCGLSARLFGVQIHFREIHSWKPVKTNYQAVEYHLSSILFNMDSAIECMVFVLNALGYVTNANQFLDITNEIKLKQISPYNILKNQCSGYDNYFPTLKKFWQKNEDLIEIIFENHDVSKHRESIFKGGKARKDPPSGFFEKMGIKDDEGKQILFSPMAEIILIPHPKNPLQQRNFANSVKLEDIAKRFCLFINGCGVKAFEDAKTMIKLNLYDLNIDE
jgi:hypothetical protein